MCHKHNANAMGKNIRNRKRNTNQKIKKNTNQKIYIKNNNNQHENQKQQ